ncbi:hypothetical protein L484_024378 [Morus notabilis]|uniref:Uncharacterized protein n=1 Tax=Morus notabilis TaxID=981085 RepID=W9SLH9_9ROSA|nr:hypothetical protein L484_024378 [Morus notabilis]
MWRPVEVSMRTNVVERKDGSLMAAEERRREMAKWARESDAAQIQNLEGVELPSLSKRLLHQSGIRARLFSVMMANNRAGNHHSNGEERGVPALWAAVHNLDQRFDGFAENVERLLNLVEDRTLNQQRPRRAREGVFPPNRPFVRQEHQ